MDYLHYQFNLQAGDVIEVILEGRANVRLLDDVNFALYQSRKSHHYRGGFAKESPVLLDVPHAGHWHVVVDLGGFAGTVRATARVLREVPA